MKQIATLLAIGAIIGLAVPAHAALDACIKVTGSKQGVFNGAGKSKSRWLPVLSFDHSVISPRDPASGLASGKRQHKPFTFTVVDADSPEFVKALADKEVLPSVMIECRRPASAGKIEVYLTIELKNVTVGKVNWISGPKGGPARIREIQLAYMQFTETQSAGKLQAQDDWMS